MEVKGMRVDLNRVSLGQLKAFADVTFVSPVGELTIRGFRVLQEEGKTPWVGMPTTNEKRRQRYERSTMRGFGLKPKKWSSAVHASLPGSCWAVPRSRGQLVGIGDAAVHRGPVYRPRV